MHPLRSTFPLFLALFTLGIVAHVAAAPPFLPEVRTVSTVPPNGDLNPYGVAFVPHGFRPVGTSRRAIFSSRTLIISKTSKARARLLFGCARQARRASSMRRRLDTASRRP